MDNDVVKLERPQFGLKLSSTSHDGKDIGFGAGFGKEGKKDRLRIDGDDSNEDSMISDSMIGVGNQKLTASQLAAIKG